MLPTPLRSDAPTLRVSAGASVLFRKAQPWTLHLDVYRFRDKHCVEDCGYSNRRYE